MLKLLKSFFVKKQAPQPEAPYKVEPPAAPVVEEVKIEVAPVAAPAKKLAKAPAVEDKATKPKKPRKPKTVKE